MVRLKENEMATNTTTSSKAYCIACGKWPATLYVNLDNKMPSKRVCEDCVKEGVMVKGDDGIYRPKD